MMCYADIVLPYFIDEEDRSYPHPAEQLAWRLDDLVDRLEELNHAGAPRRNGYRLSNDDIRYALAEDLDTLHDVEAAIEFAKEDLINIYGVAVDDVQASPAKSVVGPKPYEQLTLYARDTQAHAMEQQAVA